MRYPLSVLLLFGRVTHLVLQILTPAHETTREPKLKQW
uniref:ABC transporter (Membrane protein) n=1 Tax=mine drainage metagenome TaxID=410659 RepID=E6PWG8_9ZZZZ